MVALYAGRFVILPSFSSRDQNLVGCIKVMHPKFYNLHDLTQVYNVDQMAKDT